MSMRRAFNSRMLTKLVWVTIEEGHYNESNDWVSGAKVNRAIFGRITSGNKFSQFEEGIALKTEEGGSRFSNYRSLYVTDKFPVKPQDKVIFKNKTYNILQQSDEEVFGFNSFLIEEMT